MTMRRAGRTPICLPKVRAAAKLTTQVRILPPAPQAPTSPAAERRERKEGIRYRGA